MISSDLHAILIKVAAFGEFVLHSFVCQVTGELSDVPSFLVTLFTLFLLSRKVPCWLSDVWHGDRRDRIWISEG